MWEKIWLTVLMMIPGSLSLPSMVWVFPARNWKTFSCINSGSTCHFFTMLAAEISEVSTNLKTSGRRQRRWHYIQPPLDRWLDVLSSGERPSYCCWGQRHGRTTQPCWSPLLARSDGPATPTRTGSLGAVSFGRAPPPGSGRGYYSPSFSRGVTPSKQDPDSRSVRVWHQP